MQLIECPRDAMQGLKTFIPTEDKVRYINQLLKVGFHTIDFGSFVSPRAIPQLADTEEVLQGLDLENTESSLLSIVANVRGAEQAARFPQIRYLGYPFSVSEIFQKRNTNKTIAESRELVREILDICKSSGQELVVYISMGFGNPYEEDWSPAIVERFCEELVAMGVGVLSLSDTIGSSEPQSIRQLFSTLIPAFPSVQFGAHLHTHPATWREKVEAAYEAGCRRFDGAIKGFGGCPMADDDLVGNMATENLLNFAQQRGALSTIDKGAFDEAMRLAIQIFPTK